MEKEEIKYKIKIKICFFIFINIEIFKMSLYEILNIFFVFTKCKCVIFLLKVTFERSDPTCQYQRINTSSTN